MYQESDYEEYTDKVDVTFDISLHEYGIIRNPKTDETIFCLNPTDDFPPDGYEYEYRHATVTIEEVREAVRNMEDGLVRNRVLDIRVCCRTQRS